MDESASETTSRHAKAHVLTKSFHESDRDKLESWSKKNARDHQRQTREPGTKTY